MHDHPQLARHVGAASGALLRNRRQEPGHEIVERRRHFRRIHGLLEHRGFLTMLAARLMPGVPATGLHYAAGISPVGMRAFAGAITLGALLRTSPYAVLGQGIGSGSLATIAICALRRARGRPWCTRGVRCAPSPSNRPEISWCRASAPDPALAMAAARPTKPASVAGVHLDRRLEPQIDH